MTRSVRRLNSQKIMTHQVEDVASLAVPMLSCPMHATRTPHRVTAAWMKEDHTIVASKTALVIIAPFSTKELCALSLARLTPQPKDRHPRRQRPHRRPHQQHPHHRYHRHRRRRLWHRLRHRLRHRPARNPTSPASRAFASTPWPRATAPVNSSICTRCNTSALPTSRWVSCASRRESAARISMLPTTASMGSTCSPSHWMFTAGSNAAMTLDRSKVS